MLDRSSGPHLAEPLSRGSGVPACCRSRREILDGVAGLALLICFVCFFRFGVYEAATCCQVGIGPFSALHQCAAAYDAEIRARW
jgi:hypothetical protein